MIWRRSGPGRPLSINLLNGIASPMGQPKTPGTMLQNGYTDTNVLKVLAAGTYPWSILPIPTGLGKGCFRWTSPGRTRRAQMLLSVEKRVRGHEGRPGKKVQRAREREREAQEARRRSLPGQRHPEGGIKGKLLSPSRRRQAVVHVCDTLYVSERRACKVLGQQRSTQSHPPRIYDEEELLTERIIALATEYGRYGYRMITGLLRNEGWRVNHKRVERIWRREGLKVPRGSLREAGSGSTMAPA